MLMLMQMLMNNFNRTQESWCLCVLSVSLVELTVSLCVCVIDRSLQPRERFPFRRDRRIRRTESKPLCRCDPRDDRASSGRAESDRWDKPRTKWEERWRWAMGAFRRDRRTDGRAMAMNGRAMAMGRGEFQGGREVRLEFAGFRASSGIG